MALSLISEQIQEEEWRYEIRMLDRNFFQFDTLLSAKLMLVE